MPSAKKPPKPPAKPRPLKSLGSNPNGPWYGLPKEKTERYKQLYGGLAKSNLLYGSMYSGKSRSPSTQQLPKIAGKNVDYVWLDEQGWVSKIDLALQAQKINEKTSAAETEDFNRWANAVYNTSRILDTALKHGCYRIGIGYKDDSFAESKKIPKDWWTTGLFVEGKNIGRWPNAWAIAHDSGFGNKSGRQGFAPIQERNVIRGIHEYDHEDAVWKLVVPKPE
jgi:hypothetical protein